MYYFLHGRVPFFDQNAVKLREKIKNEQIVFDENINESLKDVISRCLEKNHKNRINLQELIVIFLNSIICLLKNERNING